MERQRKTIDSQIKELEAKKTRYQERIDEYKKKQADVDSQIKELQEAQKQKDLEVLRTEIIKSGKTTEEFLAALKEQIVNK
jgi:chromosome segregation ATPase